jgi:L-histidine Nalpha-methyltransferase
MPSSTGASAPAVDRGLVDVALSGLSRPQKMLPAKLFYDEEGCRLFYRITELPEYYLTRTERALLPKIAPLAVAGLPPNAALVEYGASDEAKANDLLRQRNAAGQPAVRAYVPIDVALSALDRMRARLAGSHPTLHVHPIAADFMQPIVLPEAVVDLPRLGFFPGSTIGNLDPVEATRFLVQARATLGAGARFLVGADLRKDPAILLPAYDDAAGVTAAFNRNLLVRLNREAGAEFVVSAFDHRAVWNDEESRIEMYLVSRHRQTARIAGREVHFAAGETIHTENSYKHTAERFIEIAARAGWRARDTWTDPERLFALYLLE